MNAAALLALIGDLYAQLAAANQRNTELEAQLVAATAASNGKAKEMVDAGPS